MGLSLPFPPELAPGSLFVPATLKPQSVFGIESALFCVEVDVMLDAHECRENAMQVWLRLPRPQTPSLKSALQKPPKAGCGWPLILQHTMISRSRIDERSALK